MQKAKPHILVTAYPEFDETGANSSEVLARKLAENPSSDAHLTITVLPNSYQRVAVYLSNQLQNQSYDAIISLGQAGGNERIRLERLALNFADASASKHPDVEGKRPRNTCIVKGAPVAYETTLPVWDMVEKLRERGHDIEHSYFAGTHLCNYVYFLLLHYACQRLNNTPPQVLFAHIPYLDSQVPTLMRPRPFITQDEACHTLASVVSTVASYVSSRIPAAERGSSTNTPSISRTA